VTLAKKGKKLRVMLKEALKRTEIFHLGHFNFNELKKGKGYFGFIRVFQTANNE
jgi:hypothetical protein